LKKYYDVECCFGGVVHGAIVTRWELWPVPARAGAWVRSEAIPGAWRNKLENVTKVEDLAVVLGKRQKFTLDRMERILWGK
jgi:hypothetical protein